MTTWRAFGLVMMTVTASACADSYGPLELSQPVGVATVPFEITLSRQGESACDTHSKINPCRPGSEGATVISARCDATDCIVSPSQGSVRVVAARPGKYGVHVEARGTKSGETVSADTTVEVLDVHEVEVAIKLDFGSPLYTALGEGANAVGYAELVARDGRTVAWEPAAIAWSAEGNAVAPSELPSPGAFKIDRAKAGATLVRATLAPEVTGETRLQVGSPRSAVRTVVAVRGYDIDATEIDATVGEHATYVPIELRVGYEDAAGSLFAGDAGALLRVEGAGCRLANLPARASTVDTARAARDLDVDIGARCTLLVGSGSDARRMLVKRDPDPQPPRTRGS